jgi:alkaline phosphatase
VSFLNVNGTIGRNGAIDIAKEVNELNAAIEEANKFNKAIKEITDSIDID